MEADLGTATARPALTTWVTDPVREEFERVGSWDGATWFERFSASAAADPGAAAVVDESGSISRGELQAQGRRLAAYLRGRGVRAGDVVTLVVPNWIEFAVIHSAVGFLGAVVNPLLPRMGAGEIGHILRTGGSRFVLAAEGTRGASPLAAARLAAADADSVIDVLAVRVGDHEFEQILSEPWEERIELPPVAADATAWDTVTFTSGTEALAKGVVHTHQSTMFGLRAYINGVLGLDGDDTLFMPSPICHASGLQWGLRTALHIGAPLVLQDRWDPAVALGLIDRHRCTYTLAATPFIVDLVEARRRGTGDGRSLRYVASGGAPIPRRLVRDVRDVFDAELMAVFGASETYVTTATRPGSSEAMLATDGAALPGVEIDIVDEVGRSLPVGQQGEIVTRGPQVFAGYLGDPDLTRRAFRGEWYRFGDLGVVDADGMLKVTGRIKDIVIRGGENISVREVEELLLSHPAVESVAVVGYPDDRLGERCCAVVVPAAGSAVTLDDLTTHLRAAGLATYKLPERLVVVEEMPTTATGKIRKAELRAAVAAGDR